MIWLWIKKFIQRVPILSRHEATNFTDNNCNFDQEISLFFIVYFKLVQKAVHRMLRVLLLLLFLLLLLLLLLLCHVVTSSQSQICLSVRFGFVHGFICICWMHTPCTLRTHSVHAQCTLRARSVHFPCTLPARSVHDPCMLLERSVHAQCTLRFVF